MKNNKAVYYHNKFVMHQNDDEVCYVDAFESVHLDYWACVEMWAEGKRDKTIPMKEGWDCDNKFDDEKEHDFIKDLWNGKIPYLEIRDYIKACPCCGTIPKTRDSNTAMAWVISCPNCGLTITKSHSYHPECSDYAKEEVIKRWNRRVNE